MTNELHQTERTRGMLRKSHEHLDSARQKLAAGSDYTGLLDDSLRAARMALQAFLTWHQVPIDENTSLLELVESSSNLARGLETPARTVLLVEPLSRSIRGRDGDRLSVDERDTIRGGYYAARNTYFAVQAELPETIGSAVEV